MTQTPSHWVGLIGWPVEHSVSPSMHNAAFRKIGLNWEYRLLPTAPGSVKTTLGALEGDGCSGANVTVPHKQAVMPYLDDIAQSARVIGAVNTIVVRQGKLSGYNTDGDGFLAGLREAGFEPAGRPALVLGAGGSARAVVSALAEAGSPVSIHNRTAERAASLVQHLRDMGVRSRLNSIPEDAELGDLDLGRFDLLVHPARHEDADALVSAALARLARASRLFSPVPTYLEPVARALVRCGFQEGPEYVALAKRTTVPLKMPQLAPAGLKQA